MSDTLPLRAARYFGYAKDPRASIMLPPAECLIVGYSRYESGRTVLMHYSERYGRPSGTFIRLTPKQREKLLVALTKHASS